MRWAGREDPEEQVHELFLAHYARLAGWARRLVDDDELAHDLVTEAFTRLLSRWSSVHDPVPWLHATIANLVRDHWRQRGRERAALSRIGPPADVAAEQDLDSRSTVRTLVEALPERLRVPVLLHYYADLPVGQIAQVTGKAEGTVKRALFDARARMAAALEEVQ